MIADHDYPPRVCFTLMNKVGLGGGKGGREGRKKRGTEGEEEEEGGGGGGGGGEGGRENLWLISRLSGELSLSLV